LKGGSIAPRGKTLRKEIALSSAGRGETLRLCRKGEIEKSALVSESRFLKGGKKAMKEGGKKEAPRAKS